jgi:hypothetical protein
MICILWHVAFIPVFESHLTELEFDLSIIQSTVYIGLIHSQAIIVQDRPLVTLSGFLDHTHTDTR